MNTPWLAFAFAVPVLAACGSRVDGGDGGTGGTTATTSCAAGLTSYVPGCDDDPAKLLAPGCYAPCTTEGTACPSGGTCRTVSANPCVCDPTPGVACCDACGMDVLLCAP